MKTFKSFIAFVTAAMTLSMSSCGVSNNLQSEAESLMAKYGDDMGCAVIINDSDTISVNGLNYYPLGEAVKVYQAVAIADLYPIDADSLIALSPAGLKGKSWQAMLDTLSTDSRSLNVSVADLVKISLTDSDNNAADLLHYMIVPLRTVDYLLKQSGDEGFDLLWSPGEIVFHKIEKDPNYATPLSGAVMINNHYPAMIQSGEDFKIDAAVLASNSLPGIRYVTLPDGNHFSLAISNAASEKAAKIADELSLIVANSLTE